VARGAAGGRSPQLTASELDRADRAELSFLKTRPSRLSCGLRPDHLLAGHG
jgi:hypothetical protein